MNLAKTTRRALVVTGMSIGMAVGMVAIRTAADWTAASAVVTVPPAGIGELQARISAEQTRSAAIRAQIERLTGGSNDLAQITDRATTMAQHDETAADELQTELAQAREALASMEPAPPAPTPATTTVRRTTTTRTTTTTTATTVERHRSDDEHEEDDD